MPDAPTPPPTPPQPYDIKDFPFPEFHTARRNYLLNKLLFKTELMADDVDNPQDLYRVVMAASLLIDRKRLEEQTLAPEDSQHELADMRQMILDKIEQINQRDRATDPLDPASRFTDAQKARQPLDEEQDRIRRDWGDDPIKKAENNGQTPQDKDQPQDQPPGPEHDPNDPYKPGVFRPRFA